MLIGFTRGFRRFFLFSIIAAAVSSLMSFLMPIIVVFTVDFVIGGKDATLPAPVMALYNELSARHIFGSNLITCTVLTALCAVISGIFSYWSRVNMAKGAE